MKNPHQILNSVAIIFIGAAVCLLGLRQIAWMNESDYRMRMLERLVAAMQNKPQPAQQSK
jgi:hypothetical protein